MDSITLDGDEALSCRHIERLVWMKKGEMNGPRRKETTTTTKSQTTVAPTEPHSLVRPKINVIDTNKFIIGTIVGSVYTEQQQQCHVTGSFDLSINQLP
jgi:hypothetical protein